MVRPSTIAVLRSNAQVLELMAAQFEELAVRTLDKEEVARLQRLAHKCRLLSGEMSDATLLTAA